MRHSFCSYHFAAYRDEHATMAQSGHRSVTTFRRHYCKPIQQKVAFAFWKIRPSGGAAKIVEPRAAKGAKRSSK
jgi:integrase